MNEHDAEMIFTWERKQKPASMIDPPKKMGSLIYCYLCITKTSES